MRHLKRIVVPIIVLAVVLSAMAGLWLHTRATHAAAAVSSSCAPWTIVPGANPGSFNDQLFGVAAVSANDVWAVGGEGDQAGGPNSTLIEQWNGTAWNLVSSPNMSNAEQNVLNSVVAISASDVWAVGYYYDNASSETLALTEHWNGSSWSIVPSPNVGQSNTLTSVSADASNDVWAVGYYYDPSLGYEALIEHWGGSSWSVVPGGSGWSTAMLSGVVALSSSNAWTVGSGQTSSGGVYDTLVEHWDGTGWSVVSSPNGSSVDNNLGSVTASGANDIWAVGSAEISGSGQSATLTEHWNGTSWTVVSSYTDSTNVVGVNAAASVPGTQQILAIGYEYVSANTASLAVRWNGTNWARVQTANPSNSVNVLYGVVAISGSDAWAVGEYVPSSSAANFGAMRMRHVGPYAGIPQEQALILHYVAPARGILCQ